MKVYTYWRSTSSYRVRIALALKGITAEQAFVHLVRDGGEQRQPAYRAINPQGRVPALVLDDGAIIVQSPAIIEYLDEIYPVPPLLPTEPKRRAEVRAVAAIIGCDIHPLHNIGPLSYLRKRLGCSEDTISEWITEWIGNGLTAIEALISDDGFCFGAEPGLADLYLVPQIYAARRFNIPLNHYQKILRVERTAAAHAAFCSAHPAAQPDADK